MSTWLFTASAREVSEVWKVKDFSVAQLVRFALPSYLPHHKWLSCEGISYQTATVCFKKICFKLLLVVCWLLSRELWEIQNLRHLLFCLGKVVCFFCLLFSLFDKPVSIFIHVWSSGSFLKRNLLSFFLMTYVTSYKAAEIKGDLFIAFWMSSLKGPLLALHSPWVVKRRTATKSI